MGHIPFGHCFSSFSSSFQGCNIINHNTTFAWNTYHIIFSLYTAFKIIILSRISIIIQELCRLFRMQTATPSIYRSHIRRYYHLNTGCAIIRIMIFRCILYSYFICHIIIFIPDNILRLYPFYCWFPLQITTNHRKYCL